MKNHGTYVVKIVSWSLYDLANKFFTLNVTSFYFVRWLTIEKKLPNIFYSAAFGISIFFVIIIAPVLGQFSDITKTKRELMSFFTVMAAGLTSLLGMFENAALALIIFGLANMCIQVAIIFYNALIYVVTPPGKTGFVSGIGKMFGYIGAIVALYSAKLIAAKYGYQAVFIPSAAMLLLLSLPAMFLVKETSKREAMNLKDFLPAGHLCNIIKSTVTSFRQLKEIPGAVPFLKAAFYALCPLNVLILFMSVYMTEVFRLSEAGIIHAIITASVSGVAGSVILGDLSDKAGYKKVLYVIFFIWMAGFLAATVITDSTHIIWLSGLLGLAFGGIWSVSRALAVSLISENRIGEFFGIFALVGYASAIVGPLLWGAIDLIFLPLGLIRYKINLALLNIFIFIAVFYLKRVPAK